MNLGGPHRHTLPMEYKFLLCCFLSPRSEKKREREGLDLRSIYWRKNVWEERVASEPFPCLDPPLNFMTCLAVSIRRVFLIENSG